MSDNISVSVSPPQNIRIGVNGVVASIAGVDPINVTGQTHVVISANKATASNVGVMSLTDAGNAAPIQEILAGSYISITQNPGKSFTINAIPTPEHQSDWLVTDPANLSYIRNKPDIPSHTSNLTNDSGYITIADVPPAPVDSVNGHKGVVVLDYTDVNALPANTAIPSKTSDLTNDSGFITLAQVPTKTSELTNDGDGAGGAFIDVIDLQNVLGDYLKLSGGTITGSLTVDQSFIVSSGGSARVPTPPAADASTAVATTEWVQTIIASTGATRYVWTYGGDFIGTPPQAGYLRISTTKQTIAISTTDAGGNLRNLSAIQAGDTIAMTDDPVQGGTSEYARYNVTGAITDNGSWVSIPVTLVGESTPPVAQGQNVRVAFYMNAMASPIDGVSAGYGLTGGGMSGIVSLAIDTNVVAELSDIPTKVSAFTNDAGYITLAQVPADAVTSVNSKTGDVVLDAADVGALPANTAIPSKTSDLTNDGEGAGNGPFIDVMGLGDALTDYLPLTGGTLTGDLNANQNLNVGGNLAVIGVASGVTPAPGDSSTQFATTEFVASAVGGHDLPISSTDGTVVLDSPSTSTYTISTGGTERMRVTQDGNVGVGKAPSYRLDVDANASGLIMRAGAAGVSNGFTVISDGSKVRYSWNNIIPVDGTNAMVLDKDGNLGLSSQAALGPASRLDVANGYITVDANSAAQPAIVFRGSTDTGIFSPAVDTLAISTAGTERLRVNSSGVVVGGDVATAPPASIPGITWSSVKTGNADQIQFRLSDADRHYGYLGMTQPTFAVGGANALLDGGVTYVGCEYRNLVLFANAGDIVFATGGLGNPAEQLRITQAGQITAGAGYTPIAGLDLATKAYVDAGDAGTDFRSVPDGTPAAPAIAFAADQTTGIFREAATDCWCVSVGGQKRFEIDTVGDCYTSGWLGVATPDDATAALDVNGESIRIRQSVTPASATATGVAGEIMWDADYLYICVATNTWKRVALTSW